MKLKKYITLALAALTMVCTLAACAPNVEHRFDVNEYSAQAEATMRSISQQLAQMDSLLAVHNADLDAAFARYEDGKPGRPEGNVANTAITQDALNDWAARPGGSCMSTPRAARPLRHICRCGTTSSAVCTAR